MGTRGSDTSSAADTSERQAEPSNLLRRLLRVRVWFEELDWPNDLQYLLLWAAVVGVAGAVASHLFRLAIAGMHEVFTGQAGSTIDSFEALSWWQRMLVPMAGGALAGATLHLGARFGRSQSTSDYMEAIVVGDGHVSFRRSMVNSLSALFSGASGASIGREGPMVQLAAMLSALPGKWMGMSQPKRRQLVACGAAAGIASAYNAPIAGAFFVAEIVLGSMTRESFGPLVVASVAATLVTRALLGADALYRAPAFVFHSYWEMLPYAVLGIGCGLAAPLYLRFLRGSERVFQSLPIHHVARLTLGGAIVGCLAILRPEVCGNGYGVVFSVLHSQWAIDALLAVLLLKVIATAATFGSGAVGGVFTPTLLTGGAMGYLFGRLVEVLAPIPDLQPSAYAMIGMGAFLAATTGAPVMAVIMVFELTLNYEIILPLMLACVLGYTASRAFESRFLYGDSLERKGASRAAEHLRGLTIADLMRDRPLKLPPTATLRDIAQTFLHNRFNNIYVVDDGDRLLGAVSLHDLKEFLDQPRLDRLVIAEDVLREEFQRIAADQPLEEVLAIFESSQTERLPVIASVDDPVLVGSLSKTDLLLHLFGRTPKD
jgi:CIC family chloride channel protein